MARNVEIKAYISNLEEFLAKCAELTESSEKILKQEDHFFNANKSYLKLRKIEGETAEIIAYNRPSEGQPKLSEYDKCPIPNPDELLNVLNRAYGVYGVVKKVRHLFMLGQTRIHVDEVENLGSFMELEVVLQSNETVEYGQKVAQEIMLKLGVSDDQLVSVAYIDLLTK